MPARGPKIFLERWLQRYLAFLRHRVLVCGYLLEGVVQLVCLIMPVLTIFYPQIRVFYPNFWAGIPKDNQGSSGTYADDLHELY